MTVGGIAYAANVIISPNMGMPVPVVGQDPGPDWANNINASLGIIDSHDHSPGHGVPVTPMGLNISSDLSFLGNNATNLRSSRYSPQGSPLSLPADLGAVYVSGVDLYYNDENGNQIRITQSGSVNAGAGSISGLPSGTASASFAGSTFTWQSATNTPAIMNVGPLVIGTNTASPKTVTLAPPGGLSANYNLTFPNGLPGSTSLLQTDNVGNMSYPTTTGTGSVVYDHSPTFIGDTFVDGEWVSVPSAALSDAGLSMESKGAAGEGTLLNSIAAVDDTGSVPVMRFDVRDSLSAPVGVRPLFRWENFGTSVLDIANDGRLISRVGLIESRADTTPSDADFLGVGRGNGGIVKWESDVDTDSGTSPVAEFIATANGGAVGTRTPLFRFQNATTPVVDIVVGGGVSITGTGGNTPHACHDVTGSNSGTFIVSCASTEQITGGGVNCGGTSFYMAASYPITTSPNGWQGGCYSRTGGVSTTSTVHAMCCPK